MTKPEIDAYAEKIVDKFVLHTNKMKDIVAPLGDDDAIAVMDRAAEIVAERKLDFGAIDLRKAQAELMGSMTAKFLLFEHRAMAGAIRQFDVNGQEVFDDGSTMVAEYKVGAVKPHAQYDKSVMISYRKPGERKWGYVTVFGDDNLAYVTVQKPDGTVVYDSRTAVPCDMDKWNEVKARFARE
jgi:hypothetical protein